MDRHGALAALRDQYRRARGGAPADDVYVVDLLRRVDAATGRQARAAFAALGLHLEPCAHCGGDGLSRSPVDRGMACGICHGRGEVAASANARLREHRAALGRRGRTSNM
jgi:hypothetical protein